MKTQTLRGIKHSVGRALLILLLLLPAAAWRGQIFGIRTDGTANSNPTLQLDLSDCKKHFNKAAQIKRISNLEFQIYDSDNKTIGHAKGYYGEQGYGGRVPLFVLTNSDAIINGIVLGKNYESSEYLNEVMESGLLSTWDGIKTTDAQTIDIDAKTSATLTSQAIIIGVKSVVSDTKVKANYKLLSIKTVSSLALLILLTFAYLFPEKLMKYRTVLQLLSIAVFGLWLTWFLSFSQIIGWLSAGINLWVQLIMGFLFLLAIGLPIVFGKSFYCSWVCPFGAAQELCGKVNDKKIHITPKVAKILSYTRESIFFILMIYLWTGFTIDLVLIEPFAAFSITKAGYFTLALAGFFLMLSLFVPKAWCKYFCPTGFILEWIRK